MYESTTSGGSWIRPLRNAAQRSQVHLVCFPFAGGSAGYFHALAKSLEPDISVLGVQYPGRQDRRHEPLIEDIGRLADEIYEALAPWETQPLALFGHSMGSVVAFEVARRFERENRRAPLALFASGRRAPSCPRDEDVHAADDASFIANLRSLGGTDPALLDDDEMRRMILPVIRGDYRAVETYRAPTAQTVLNVPVMAITGDRDPSVTLAEASAWREHTAESFEMTVLTGGHFFIHEHVAEIADCVRRVLLGLRSEGTRPPHVDAASQSRGQS
ncbi:thioesterase II family protein [Streptomyces sp. 8L]|uniref:thioesterase II family protein n=1 Tax=Streptomyces sp. 8L TaxID=2877242 RepID=UPI001CD1F6B3|nr:alpha/beta fold hydrolase [Streptomyces sp. 8L]MCA1217238.1 alpha/beta fold hydrolase [Streptomyces sp. 8L]